MNVFTFPFEQLNASWLNKSLNFFKQNILLTPKFWNKDNDFMYM